MYFPPCDAAVEGVLLAMFITINPHPWDERHTGWCYKFKALRCLVFTFRWYAIINERTFEIAENNITAFSLSWTPTNSSLPSSGEDCRRVCGTIMMSPTAVMVIWPSSLSLQIFGSEPSSRLIAPGETLKRVLSIGWYGDYSYSFSYTRIVWPDYRYIDSRTFYHVCNKHKAIYSAKKMLTGMPFFSNFSLRLRPVELK